MNSVRSLFLLVMLTRLRVGTFFLLGIALFFCIGTPMAMAIDSQSDRTLVVITKGLDWLSRKQSRRGSWSANEGRYPTAMTSLAGTSMLMEGSTTTQGRYAEPIRLAVDYLVSRSRANGLIGDPKTDDRYTYGHGFSMLFL